MILSAIVNVTSFSTSLTVCLRVRVICLQHERSKKVKMCTK